MNVEEIKAAVDEGKIVHWKNTAYRVIKDNIGQYLIHYPGPPENYIGLTWQDGKTLNGEEKDFYIWYPTVEVHFNMHWEALRKQKAVLLEQINLAEEQKKATDIEYFQEQLDGLNGVLHIIDAIQDQAVESDQFSEEEVFGNLEDSIAQGEIMSQKALHRKLHGNNTRGIQ